MGIIYQGILGGFSGKVGPVVGANWKGIDYMRGYVIPSNPNTPDQQTQRSKFGAMSSIASGLLGDVIQPYWDPFAVQKSGFNVFVSDNIDTLDINNKVQTTLQMAKGSLSPIVLTGSTYDDSTGAIEVTWSANLGSNGENTDSIYCVIYDATTSDPLYSELLSETRNGAQLNDNIATGLDFNDMIVFMFPFRGTGEDFIVGDSDSQAMSEA